MSTEIQNTDITLPGGIGKVNIGGNEHEIVQKFIGNDGATTLTIKPVQEFMTSSRLEKAIPAIKNYLNHFKL